MPRQSETVTERARLCLALRLHTRNIPFTTAYTYVIPSTLLHNSSLSLDGFAIVRASYHRIWKPRPRTPSPTTARAPIFASVAYKISSYVVHPFRHRSAEYSCRAMPFLMRARLSSRRRPQRRIQQTARARDWTFQRRNILCKAHRGRQRATGTIKRICADGDWLGPPLSRSPVQKPFGATFICTLAATKRASRDTRNCVYLIPCMTIWCRFTVFVCVWYVFVAFFVVCVLCVICCWFVVLVNGWLLRAIGAFIMRESLVCRQVYARDPTAMTQRQSSLGTL